jgi:hypothetical protein
MITSDSPDAIPAISIAPKNAIGTAANPGNKNAAAKNKHARGIAFDPMLASNLGARNIVMTNPKEVPNKSIPNRLSLAPIWSFKTGTWAAKLPQNIPTTANAAAGAFDMRSAFNTDMSQPLERKASRNNENPLPKPLIRAYTHGFTRPDTLGGSRTNNCKEFSNG